MPSGPPPPTDPWLYDSSPVPLLRYASIITVSRYNPEDSMTPFEVLDNVECIEVAQGIGIDPGRAMFRYRFTGMDSDAPQSIEQALSTTSTSFSKMVQIGDRLTVEAQLPDETTQFIFDGYPLIFGLSLDSQTEDVHMIAVGVAKSAWDEPIKGQLIRDCSNIATGKDYQSDIQGQFNPKGQPNATQSTSWVNADTTGVTDKEYPTFLDPLFIQSTDVRVKWTLAMAARYLIFSNYGVDTIVAVPTGDVLDGLLYSREPITGTSFNPTDPATYTQKDIIVSDRPFTGRDWPSVLNEFVRDKGFGMVWDIGTVAGVPVDGETPPATPSTTLRLFLMQSGTLKNVNLQTQGSWIDPELSNIAEASIERDLNQVINEWEVVGALNRYEASFVLGPGFPMYSEDGATVESIGTYDKASSIYNLNADKYRLFVFDETGEGNYTIGSSSKLTSPTSLDAILGTADETTETTTTTDGVQTTTTTTVIDGVTTTTTSTPPEGTEDGTTTTTGPDKHATRRRPPIGTLFSSDASLRPYRFRVAVSTNYSAGYPKIWDRSGNWQDVSGGVQLLDDRLGIRITTDNPNEWKIGKCDDIGAPFPAGVVKLVESLCTGTNVANPQIYIRVTCVIEGDDAVSGVAEPTGGSPLDETIKRIIDARDRYMKQTVCESSEFNDGSPDIVTRDDTASATSEAIAARSASEAGILNGQITIPYMTRYYELGDRIQQINGRGLGFRTDNGSMSNTNTAIYPVVVGIRHVLKGSQQTILQLSDVDGHRHKIESKIKRK